MRVRRDVEVLKIQILADRYHSSFTAKASFCFGLIITWSLLFVSLHYQKLIDIISYTIVQFIGVGISALFLLSTYKEYKGRLNGLSELIEQVNKGKSLPSLKELLKTKKIEENGKHMSTQAKSLTPDDKENLRLEYELLKKSILERNRRTYFAISIIVPTSLLAILSCFQYRDELTIRTVLFSIPIGAMILCGILLMLILLFLLTWTAVKANEIEYDTMTKIIRLLGESGFPTLQMWEKRLKAKIWFKLRKHMWSLMVLVLIIGDLWALLTFMALVN